MKMFIMRSYDTSASSAIPVSQIVRRPMSRAMTISAPTRLLASAAEASVTSSINRCSTRLGRNALNGFVPKLASACRICCWNRINTASGMYNSRLPSTLWTALSSIRPGPVIT